MLVVRTFVADEVEDVKGAKSPSWYLMKTGSARRSPKPLLATYPDNVVGKLFDVAHFQSISELAKVIVFEKNPSGQQNAVVYIVLLAVADPTGYWAHPRGHVPGE
jgi:hypothetical protein